MRSCILFILSAAVSLAAESTHINGKVTDVSGEPIEHAAVMVYEARVRTGYSIFCPTCWPDCGKHAFTDANGNFGIAGLNPNLVFELLVVKDGYTAVFVKKVDPEKERRRLRR
jgi:hypothetical protein